MNNDVFAPRSGESVRAYMTRMMDSLRGDADTWEQQIVEATDVTALLRMNAHLNTALALGIGRLMVASVLVAVSHTTQGALFDAVFGSTSSKQ